MSFKVDFAIIGAMKSGTTDLAMRVSAHPGVCFCAEKEPHFFTRNPDWREKLESYHDLYQPLAGQITGEASTSYSFLGEYPEVVERLYAYNPDIKLIFMVRDPIDRIKSHYAHRLMHGIADLNAERELEIRKAEYLNRSRYGHTVEQYRRVFPHTQLLIVDFQQYTADPEGSMATVFEFLGLSPGAAPSTSARNTSTGSNRSQWSPIYYVDRILAYSPPFLRRLLSKYISVKLAKRPEFPVQLQQQLYRELEPDITLFESLNGSPMPAWREGRAG